MALLLSGDALTELKRLRAYNPTIRKTHPAWKLLLYTAVLNTYLATNCQSLINYYTLVVQAEQDKNPQVTIINPAKVY